MMMDRKMNLPGYVNNVIRRLTDAGYEAFVVGGCVRDFLMGRTPGDYDVCTSALPEETRAVFSDRNTIDIGIRHGTVGIPVHGDVVEVTTYRIDGEYGDSRHPEQVFFTKNLREDLARRDFTMNAIAYSPEAGFFDPFGGADAIMHRRISCVGNPVDRFTEDALRIMRALRFSATLGFDIDSDTGAAVFQCCRLVHNISAERINAEFTKLIMGVNADDVLARYSRIFEEIISGFVPAEVSRLPKSDIARLAAVFPENTAEIMRGLKYDRKRTCKAENLAELLRGEVPESVPELRMLISRNDRDAGRLFCSIRGIGDMYDNIADNNLCCSQEELDIRGRDLISAGIEAGPVISEIMQMLLEAVIWGRVENRKEKLLELALQLKINK